jgi:hypothetical protein
VRSIRSGVRGCPLFLGILQGEERGMKAPKPLEKHIQRNVLHYLKRVRVDAFHIPNGSVLAGDPRARAMQMNALKASGFVNGMPDLLLIQRTHTGSRVGFFEVKREGEKLRKEQQDFADRCTEWMIPFAVVRSIDDAKQTLTEWGWLWR